ncbi:MAG: ester cyclase, partial [Candidatus Limnocylindrales bacterium]|nr:ester cyclase [Candidatus Limnocylindrales bacterium]
EAHSANETADIQWTQPGVIIQGQEAVASLQQALWTALPDARIELVARVANADLVMSEEVLSGTQTGPFATPAGTLPPSGRSVRMRFVTVQQVREGKIAAERIYFDQLEFLGQLGITPGATPGANAE